MGCGAAGAPAGPNPRLRPAGRGLGAEPGDGALGHTPHTLRRLRARCLLEPLGGVHDARGRCAGHPRHRSRDRFHPLGRAARARCGSHPVGGLARLELSRRGRAHRRRQCPRPRGAAPCPGDSVGRPALRRRDGHHPPWHRQGNGARALRHHLRRFDPDAVPRVWLRRPPARPPDPESLPSSRASPERDVHALVSDGPASMDAHAIFGEAVAQFGRPRLATDRFQLGPPLRFDHVAALAPYLEALGVTDAYLSPCFKSGPGSSHGYDVTDHNAFNPEIGNAATFDRMVAALAARGMGIILDIVPNHMGVAGDANPWWLDVLENGPRSPRASFFDIEWDPPKPELRNKVLLPVLPNQYGEVLESGQLQLELTDGAFLLRCAGARP